MTLHPVTEAEIPFTFLPCKVWIYVAITNYTHRHNSNYTYRFALTVEDDAVTTNSGWLIFMFE